MSSSSAIKVSLTQSAAERISYLIEQEKNSALMLRLRVDAGGCSGFQYIFSLDQDIHEDDIIFENFNAKMIIDTTSLGFLDGAKVDYTRTMVSACFSVNNPNVDTSCGCGASFSMMP